MPVEENGQIKLCECDDANIPVNIFYENHGLYWTLTADNFMPRKGRCNDCSYELQAHTKEELVAYVQKYVLPLYRTALELVESGNDLYYWRKD